MKCLEMQAKGELPVTPCFLVLLWGRSAFLTFFLSFSGKAPMPRPHYKPQEPNGCSSYFLGLKVPESVCTAMATIPKRCNSLTTATTS